jgi:hypothetical protein
MQIFACIRFAMLRTGNARLEKTNKFPILLLWTKFYKYIITTTKWQVKRNSLILV